MPFASGTPYCSFTLDDEGKLRVFGLYDIQVKMPQIIANNIADVASGLYTTVAVDTEGNVWSFGDKKFYSHIVVKEAHKYRPLTTSQKMLQFMGIYKEEILRAQFSPPFEKIPNVTNIRSVFCGGNHSILIDTESNAFTFGDNDNGQLGLGDKKDRKSPTLIQNFDDISSASGGTEHSAFLNYSGELFVCGSNKSFQIGKKSCEITLKPVILSCLPNCVSVSCGSYHTLVLCSNNILFAFGNNQSGQLALDLRITKSLPIEVKLPVDSQITTISCGSTTSMVICGGSLFVWGSNIFGQLGTDSHEDDILSTPSNLNLPPVQMVYQFGYHTFVQADGRIYVFGNNKYGQLGILEQYFPQSIPTPLPPSWSNIISSPAIPIGGNVKSARK